MQTGRVQEHILKRNHASDLLGSLFHIGLGVYLYGLDEVNQEYVTTEWATFFGLPVIPVASWTVHDCTDRWAFTFLSRSEEFEVSRRDKLHPAQVRRGYSITAFVVGLLFLLPCLVDYFGAQK